MSVALVSDILSRATTIRLCYSLLLATKRDMHLAFNKEQISANSRDWYMCWLLNLHLVAQHPYKSKPLQVHVVYLLEDSVLKGNSIQCVWEHILGVWVVKHQVYD